MVLLGLMGGCITEHSGGTQMSSDPDAALDKRGALPRQYIGLGDWESAKAAFTRALLMDRRNPVALLEIGFLRLEAGDSNEAARYHGTYRTVSPQQSPRGLPLGLEIADQTGDRDALSSYELALRNLCPDFAEHRAWMERQSR